MTDTDGVAQNAGDTKSLIEVKDQVDKALFHLERLFCRYAEMTLPTDLRDPMHEMGARCMAAIYEVQAIAYQKAPNHDEIVEDAALFDEIRVATLPLKIGS